MEPIRINKYLVQLGVCSRREADRFIEAGKVLVNGSPVALGQKVTDKDTITVAGRTIDKKPRKHVYLAYNKPIGVICTSDPDARDNIIQAVHYPERIFHIGRLDVASSGLILMTNDGEIVNKILRADEKHEKEYDVKIDTAVTDEFIHAMTDGITVLGRKTLPAKVVQTGNDTFLITLVEGRNRQIRRMCEALETSVRSLKRIRIMNIELADLPIGRWRHLTPEEEKTLLASI